MGFWVRIWEAIFRVLCVSLGCSVWRSMVLFGDLNVKQVCSGSGKAIGRRLGNGGFDTCRCDSAPDVAAEFAFGMCR